MRHVWCRTSKSRRCPVCGKGDFCTISGDGTTVKCCRVHDGSTARKHGEDGAGIYTIHKLQEPVDAGTPDEVVQRLSSVHATNIAKRWHRNAPEGRLDELSASLGVSRHSLNALRVGWAPANDLVSENTRCHGAGCWTFPMRQPDGAVIGIRLRGTDGGKFAVSGSRQGLFFARSAISQGILLIVEGPTDTAAAFDLGYQAVGRPSNTAGSRMISELLDGTRCTAVIVEDNDGDGAAAKNTAAGTKSLRNKLKRNGFDAIVIRPVTFKDIRAFANAGGGRAALDRLIHDGNPATLLRKDQP